MRPSLLDDLGKAIDRLMERCRAFDKDRTELAKALSGLQASYRELEKRCQHFEARCRALEDKQENAAQRLERVLLSIPEEYREAVLPEESVTEDPAARTKPEPMYESQPESAAAQVPQGDARDPLARKEAKPFDIASLERIQRGTTEASENAFLSADEQKGLEDRQGTEQASLPAEEPDAAEPEAVYQDRLF